MRVIRREEALGGGDAGDPSNFVGEVTIKGVARYEQSAGISVVQFKAGAHNHWHVHAGGQVLHVISGRGRVQAEGGEVVELEPGDFVVAEAGEKHWHGAADGADMAHISIASGGIEWFAPVADA